MVKFYEAFHTNNNYYMIFEYLENAVTIEEFI